MLCLLTFAKLSTLDHAVLLDKLSNLGILDKEHGWFTDYLSNRTQVVEFQGVTSASEALSTGVPQGSILLSSYLGIVFDDHLSWNEQIKYLISKA